MNGEKKKKVCRSFKRERETTWSLLFDRLESRLSSKFRISAWNVLHSNIILLSLSFLRDWWCWKMAGTVLVISFSERKWFMEILDWLVIKELGVKERIFAVHYDNELIWLLRQWGNKSPVMGSSCVNSATDYAIMLAMQNVHKNLDKCSESCVYSSIKRWALRQVAIKESRDSSILPYREPVAFHYYDYINARMELLQRFRVQQHH